jgi:transcription elongation GreA/GreB family factor
MTDIKQKLYEACLRFVENRFKTITNTIALHQEALTSETKSSAGDKHETGRAMLQLEMEKAGQQLASAQAMKEALSKIRFKKKNKNIGLGSLVITDKVTYFLAVSAGIITIDKNNYYTISTLSPIGQHLLGKTVGDIIAFNKATILEVY